MRPIRLYDLYGDWAVKFDCPISFFTGVCSLCIKVSFLIVISSVFSGCYHHLHETLYIFDSLIKVPNNHPLFQGTRAHIVRSNPLKTLTSQ